ncbi:TPA: Rpn family recombination-promoting nuclease/putative transposase [Streptococcus suis]
MRHTRLKPTYDTVAKKIFQNKEVTKHFIADILDLPVKSVELLDGHQIRLPQDGLPRGFYTVTDILVELDDGTQVIIEIQIVKQRSFVNRLWTYICSQVHDNFENIRKEFQETHLIHERLYPVYGIALLEKNYFSDDKAFHIFSIREETTNQELTIKLKDSPKDHSLLKMAFLELDKYQPETFDKNQLKKWFEFFGNREFTAPLDKIIHQAEHALDFASWSKEEQAMFNDELDILEVNHSRIYWAREEGRAEGREEGQQQASYSIARNLLSANLPPELIAQSTGLSLSQIHELQGELLTNS